jgi:hypothetical protein
MAFEAGERARLLGTPPAEVAVPVFHAVPRGDSSEEKGLERFSPQAVRRVFFWVLATTGDKVQYNFKVCHGTIGASPGSPLPTRQGMMTHVGMIGWRERIHHQRWP